LNRKNVFVFHVLKKMYKIYEMHLNAVRLKERRINSAKMVAYMFIIRYKKRIGKSMHRLT